MLKINSYTLSMEGHSVKEADPDINLAFFYSDYRADTKTYSVNFSSTEVPALKENLDICMVDFREFTEAALAADVNIEIEEPENNNGGSIPDEGEEEEEEI